MVAVLFGVRSVSVLSKTEVKHKCQKSIYSNWGHHDCGKTAKYEHNGKWYCGIHNPPVVAARDKARREARDAEYNARQALRDAKDAVTAAEANVLSMVSEYDDLPIALQGAYDELCEARIALEAVSR